MLLKKLALAGAAAAALFVADSAVARTSHPSTAAERQATDDLNAKALADARTGVANQPTASTNPQPALTSPTETMAPSPTTAPDTNMTTPSPDAAAPMPAPTDATPSTTNPQPSPTNNNGVNTPDAAPAPTQPEQPANGQ